MALSIVNDGSGRRLIGTASGSAQAMTSDAVTVLTGSDIDVAQFSSACATIVVSVNTLCVGVFGANKSDYSDEVLIRGSVTQGTQPAVAGSVCVFCGPNAATILTPTTAPTAITFRYLRIKTINNVNGANGSAAFNWMCRE